MSAEFAINEISGNFGYYFTQSGAATKVYDLSSQAGYPYFYTQVIFNQMAWSNLEPYAPYCLPDGFTKVSDWTETTISGNAGEACVYTKDNVTVQFQLYDALYSDGETMVTYFRAIAVEVPQA